VVKKEVRRVKRRSWETFVSKIEHGVHGRQTQAYKLLKDLNKNERDKLELKPITGKEWLEYYHGLWTADNREAAKVTPDEDNVDPITTEELMEVIKNIKSRKLPGSDGISNELFKYALKSFLFKFLDSLNICWICGHIPEEWRTQVIVPIHKKATERTATATGKQIC
jgi:hypothetical protein